jgi:hypothetical protein
MSSKFLNLCLGLYWVFGLASTQLLSNENDSSQFSFLFILNDHFDILERSLCNTANHHPHKSRERHVTSTHF